jgi:hypothetical protein
MIEKGHRFLTDGYGYGYGYGYGMIQRTRPQTIGYSLVDSPSGLAAWLGEKLVAMSDTRPEFAGG